MYNLQPGQGLGFDGQKIIAYGLGGAFSPFISNVVKIFQSIGKKLLFRSEKKWLLFQSIGKKLLFRSEKKWLLFQSIGKKLLFRSEKK